MVAWSTHLFISLRNEWIEELIILIACFFAFPFLQTLLTYAMKKEGDEWIFPVHLSTGKHLYKFIVDDKWMNDPDNTLWEQNEYGNGNSVLWIGR